MKGYDLYFNGYWTEDHISGIPHKPGIYLVYKCIPEDHMVTLKALIYIGQAEDLNERISTHDKKDKFKQQCQGNETLCYSVAELPMTYLSIVENALIFAQKPELNTLGKESFDHPMPVSFRLEGRCGLMEYKNFTITSEKSPQ